MVGMVPIAVSCFDGMENGLTELNHSTVPASLGVLYFKREMLFAKWWRGGKSGIRGRFFKWELWLRGSNSGG